MKITTVLFLLVFLGIDNTYSQRSVKGAFQTTLGIGISNFGAPYSLGFDYGLYRDISLGIELNQRFSNETFLKYRILGGNFNVNYHFNNLLQIVDERWDLYAGGYFNYWLVTESIKKIETDSANIGYGGQIGMRYFFNDHFAFNTELGIGLLDGKHYLRDESKLNGCFKIGLTYKF